MSLLWYYHIDYDKSIENTTFYDVLKLNEMYYNVSGDYMIKEYRKKRGYTQDKFAQTIGISLRQLQRIEANEENTKIKTLKKIIKVLNISDEEIIDYMKK